ncbi:MAG: hypothetical protein ACYTGL_20445 [Planctomycetota bacterium]|jgi:hypothetical protein
MNRSIHPPLYLLVAVSSYFLGATLDQPVNPSQPDSPADIAVLTRPLDASEPPPESFKPDNVPGSATLRNSSTLEPTVVPADSAANSPLNGSSESATTTLLVDQSGPLLHTTIGSVEIFPASNEWNQPIDDLPVHQMSSVWLRSIGLDRGLHPDFGTTWRGAPNGIPFVVVPSNYPKRSIPFEYADESDPGPYPIPPNPPIEGGPDAPWDSDRHVIMIDPQKKLLYELFQVLPDPIHGWRAGSGAIFDLSRNHHRPIGWTSADAAGLPIFPGLVRYDEVVTGEIRHALRFTVQRTQRAYIFPARHFASRSNDPNLPPMGLRVRLKADYDISAFPPSARVILTALKRYGMLLADNGSDWFVSGAPDTRWNDSELATLKQIKGRDLECVYTGELTR